MKLAEPNVDYRMADLPLEHEGGTGPSSSRTSSAGGVPNTYLQLTPSVTASQPITQQKPRRSTVSIACERCRKRKTKCSGLPGPCTNCARLGVPCHEPGRRRLTVQSTLEDRMQRLRSLSATTSHHNVADGQSQMPTSHPWFNLSPAESSQTATSTHVNAGAMLNASGFGEMRVPSPASAHSSEGWAAAGDLASYFDRRLQEVDWDMGDFPSENASITSRRSPQHDENERSQMLPIEIQNLALRSQDAPTSTEGYAIAMRESMSPSAYQAPSPVERRQTTPIGFTISYDSAFFEESNNKASESNQPSPAHARDTDAVEDDTIQFTGLILTGPKPSPQPSPTLSTAIPRNTLDPPSELTGYQLTRSQTVPTSYPEVSESEVLHETDLLSLIIRSAETRRYMEQYFTRVHLEYPFLDPAILEGKRALIDQLPSFNYNLVLRQKMVQFQALMVAAIGALVQLGSLQLASQYVKQATTIQDQFEMWSSVGGIHCAMLLSLYCYLAQVIVYDTRQDEGAEAHHAIGLTHRQSRYPVSNLWLHNCQIAAACIDLGMHQPLAMQEQIRAQTDVRTYLDMCRNTIRSAYMLDRKISELRNRPRAFHDEDIDRHLLVDLA